MFKYIYYSLLISFSFLIISCSKTKNYEELIPANTNYVLSINTKSIAEKGNFKDLSEHKWFNFLKNEVDNTSPEIAELFKNIQENPTNAGIDIISPIYIFGKDYKSSSAAVLIANMRNKNKFEDQLKIIYKGIYNKEIDFEEIDNYTFIKGDRRPFIAWNKKQFIYIAGKTSHKNDLDGLFKDLINYKEPLNKSISFKDFISKAEDINFWYTGDFIKEVNPNSLLAKTYKNCSWSTYLSFKNDKISFTQKFFPDVFVQEQITKRPVWKKKINTDFFKYFPQASYFNVGVGFYPNNERLTIENQDFINDFLDDYGLSLNLVKENIDGDLLFSIFDFYYGKKHSINGYFENKNQVIKTVPIPQFILGIKVKNDKILQELTTSLKDKKGFKDNSNHYTFSLNTHQNIFFAQKHDIIYITNNYEQINNFINNRVEKINFINSDFSNGAKNAMFVNANLKYEDYPVEVQDYINQFMFIKPDIIYQLENLEFKIQDEYNKTGSITLKPTNKNALITILNSIDNMFF